MTEITIPFNRSSLMGREQEYIAEAMRHGQIAGDQTFGRRCEELLRGVLGAPRVLLTTSCTHALEMAGVLLGIGPGDEVIVPSFTFVSTANAYTMHRATPVFADIRPDTLNIDEARIESLISPRTKAIAIVHYAGVGCALDAITDIAKRHGLRVIEDNAHGLFGRYRGRPLGTFGALATQSFHETKNITCGEGGALVVNDPELVERSEIIREKGTNRAQFFRGEVDKYTWVDVGSSYVMSDVLAAFLLGQLEEWETIQAKREHIWDTYQRALADWAARHNVRVPTVPDECQQAYHMYYLVMPSPELRQRFIAHLRHHGILSVFHYQPLHASPMGQRLGGGISSCPVAEEVSGRLVRLPFFNSITDAQLDRTIEVIRGAL
jgi:dTDP-4-amino-4,6-dideoxygalactose transaminase